MGARFRLEHANIMGYITSPNGSAPRVRRASLREFLDMLVHSAREYLIPERGFEEWPEQISAVAREGLERLDREAHGDAAQLRSVPFRVREDEATVTPARAARVLEPLRTEFSHYSMYAMAVGQSERLRGRARYLAQLPLYGNLLVLLPEPDTSSRNFEVLDPVPVFSRALHSVQKWPGFLFWTVNGTSLFVSDDEVDRLARDLLDLSSNRNTAGRRLNRRFSEYSWSALFDDVLRRYAPSPSVPQRRLLHISDLHFGTNDALENQAMLEAELREVVNSVDRVVITGDLIDTPKRESYAMFANFKNSLTHVAKGRAPIVIPGNHDQRVWGNFGREFEHIAVDGSRKVVVDDECEMIFVGFNSSEQGSFARGKIPASQFKALGGEYRTHLAARKELKRYLPIVLVHHHPFSFDVPPETWVQKALRAIGLRDESFLEMVNAGDLHRWCADWDIRTILHGHKHKYRYEERSVKSNANQPMLLTAIGCGSSLGAEGSPVSYNILEWEPSMQRWVVSVFESTGGGAFLERVAAVSPVR